MILLSIFFFNILPVSASTGIIFTEESKAKRIFGSIYEGNINLFPAEINKVYFGIMSDFLYKRTNPFRDDYFQNSNLHAELVSLGAGPILMVRIHKKVSIGMLFKANYMWITYFEPGTNSIIYSKTIRKTASGTEIFAYLTPLSMKPFDIGLEFGFHATGYGGFYYLYEEYDYDPFDYLKISGFVIKLMIVRS